MRLGRPTGRDQRRGSRADELAALRELVQQELVVTGGASDGGVAAWSEPLEQTLVSLEWVGQIEERDRRGFSCCLSTTRPGDARAWALHVRSPVTDAEHGGE